MSRLRFILCLAFTVGLAMTIAQAETAAEREAYQLLRQRMVNEQLKARGIKDERVLSAMAETPRHRLVPQDVRDRAYEDDALPIGYGQTISPPYIVALMTEKLRPRPSDKVLEIGTGSGYQAAVLSRLVKEVYTIEIVKPLAERAENSLRDLGRKNVHVRAGDGYLGWPSAAPFDAVIVTCAPDHVPQPLVDQLKVGGRMVIPVGKRYVQELYLFEKRADGLTKKSLLPVFFVPMTGKAQTHAESAGDGGPGK